MTNPSNLIALGWMPFFQQQLTLDDLEHCLIARVVAQHRSQVELLSESGSITLPLLNSTPILTVGDWVLLNADYQFERLLERSSLFSRKSAGSKMDTQLIAANVDTVLIVSSLNQDFNLNRIERYLSLAHEVGVEPVVVLTKADDCEDPKSYIQQVQAIDPFLQVVALNALDTVDVSNQLSGICQAGNTLVMLGSSGVGKSTLINALLGDSAQKTAGIREDDDKGRHTTTARTLLSTTSGVLIIDTPGMRELQLADCEQGIESTFVDISTLAEQCRFSDCQHESEPGCAVRQALEAGQLDPRRLKNYLKLLREQAFNSASLAEKRARDKQLGRLYRSIKNEKSNRKGRQS